ncbi:ABC transporter substrate-binding protein [Jiangella muralis]|uniref:ABC transporter substrate-binding protein n=1 Tax=Jiangella muralis TaxID=702383 RepID=UPI00069DEDE3|nr:ABC transporter substrate-binding protein [Jiangella muralis]
MESTLMPHPSRRTVVVGIAGTGLVLGCGALFSACGGAENSTSNGTGKPTAGGTLRVGASSDPDSLDPHKSSLDVSQEIYCGIFSRLVDVSSTGEISPSLATEWEQPDDLTYVFTLRPDVTFHDGAPFEAREVVYTFDRIRDPDFGSISAAFFTALDTVEATGQYEVTFNLSRPSAAFLTNLAVYGHVVSQKTIEEGDPVRKPVGTGPFALASWTQGRGVELSKASTYFETDRPLLDAVSVSYLENTEGRVLALRSDELDWVDAIPKQSIEQVKNDKTLRYISGTEGTPQFLIFNSGAAPFDNLALRQAVCWAIDREEIAKIAHLGTAEPGRSEFGSKSRWYPEDDPYASAPDEDMVRSKLAEAGYPDGGVTINFLAWTSSPDAVATAQVIAEQLRPYNIELEIEQIEISSWLERVNAREYELTLRIYGGLTDPDQFWSRNWTTTSASNWSGYGSEEFDQLIIEAGSVDDEDTRRQKYDALRAKALGDGATLFTAFVPKAFAARADVAGSEVNPGGDPRFRNVGRTA